MVMFGDVLDSGGTWLELWFYKDHRLRSKAKELYYVVYTTYNIWIQDLFIFFEGFFIWHRDALSECFSSYLYFSYVYCTFSTWGICFQVSRSYKTVELQELFTTFCSARTSAISLLMDLQFSNFTTKWQQRPNVSLLIADDCGTIWTVTQLEVWEQGDPRKIYLFIYLFICNSGTAEHEFKKINWSHNQVKSVMTHLKQRK